jgi:hypothetical protein
MEIKKPDKFKSLSGMMQNQLKNGFPKLIPASLPIEHWQGH